MHTHRLTIEEDVVRKEYVSWTAGEDAPLVDDALGVAPSWLVGDAPQFDRMADPVQALGDGNLANVLWDGETCRFVDFEELGTSDLAYEVADQVEHASSRLGRTEDQARHVLALLGG